MGRAAKTTKGTAEMGGNGTNGITHQTPLNCQHTQRESWYVPFTPNWLSEDSDGLLWDDNYRAASLGVGRAVTGRLAAFTPHFLK